MTYLAPAENARMLRGHLALPITLPAEVAEHARLAAGEVGRGETAASVVDVAVCVPTYRRPEFLAALLRSLAGLETAGLTARVLVVDNDAAGSARPVVESFMAALPGLTYVVEPERGIAAARNRLALLAGATGAEFVAFVDDDEWVEPGWLVALVETARAYGADAVGGRVVPECEVGVPDWIARGGFFERPRFQTGAVVGLRSTSNLLLRRAWLERVEGPFDRRFDLTGGSDAHLLERLGRQGARMIWCDEAVVHEQIPVSRANARWLLRRAFRSGLTSSRSTVALDPQPLVRAGQVTRAAGGIGKGGALFLLALPRGRGAIVHALRVLIYEVGRLLGIFGVSYEEYRRVHGR